MRLWTGIITDKVHQSKDFYNRLFSSEVLHETEGGRFVLPGLGDSELGLMRPNQGSQAAVFRPAFEGRGVWIAVDVENADAEYKRLQALGVPIDVDLRDEAWGHRRFVAVDPNGIGVDVVQRVGA